MTLHGSPTEKRRRKRLPEDKYCVAACFGVAGWSTTKDLPGFVKHDIEWLQRQLISRQGHLWAECWVNWSVMSITQGCTLTRNRKRISWSRLVKPWASKLTKAKACYLREKPSGCISLTGSKGWAYNDNRCESNLMLQIFCPALDSVVVSRATRWPTQATFSTIVWTEAMTASLMLKLWWLLYFDPLLIFYSSSFCFWFVFYCST